MHNRINANKIHNWNKTFCLSLTWVYTPLSCKFQKEQNRSAKLIRKSDRFIHLITLITTENAYRRPFLTAELDWINTISLIAFRLNAHSHALDLFFSRRHLRRDKAFQNENAFLVENLLKNNYLNRHLYAWVINGWLWKERQRESNGKKILQTGCERNAINLFSAPSYSLSYVYIYRDFEGEYFVWKGFYNQFIFVCKSMFPFMK